MRYRPSVGGTHPPIGCSWDASRMTVRQQQCAGYTVPYTFISPGSYRFWEERDPYTQKLIAIKMYFQTSESRAPRANPHSRAIVSAAVIRACQGNFRVRDGSDIRVAAQFVL